MKKPNLYPTETALARAFGFLDDVDPDCEMSADEQESVLLRFVDRDAAVEARDEFADWLVDMETWAAAKQEAAAKLVTEAKAILARVERAKDGTIKLMRALGVEELRGKVRRLTIAKSRGAVNVIDESAVPESFWRVPDDPDAQAIAALGEKLLDVYGTALQEQKDALLDGGVDLNSDAAKSIMAPHRERIAWVNALLTESRLRHRKVDKVAVQDAWKANGGDDARESVPTEAVIAVEAEKEKGALTPAQAAEKLAAAAIREPVVPGCEKQVTFSLKVR